MRKLLAAVGLSLALVVPGTALAATMVSGNNVTLAKGDNRTGTYYAAGQTITVDGDVNGDVVCAGQTVVVNGSVSGDVLCAAQELTVNGTVAGSVRSVGQVVTINGTVGRNVMAAGQNVVLGSNSHVTGELAAAGQNVSLHGPIDQDVMVATNNLELDGLVGGNLNYMSNDTLALDHSKVKGSIKRQAPPHQAAPSNSVAGRLGSLLFWVLSGLVVALAAVWLTPRLVRNVTDAMITRPGLSLGWGVIGVLGAPLALLVLAVTVIGLPLAFLLGAVWTAILLTASLLAGAAVGILAMGRKETSRKYLTLAVLGGVPLVLIVSWIPILGLFVSLGALAWAMGGVVLAAIKAY